jgi:hypothetical protein
MSHPNGPPVRKEAVMTATTRPSRSLIVSWLLGASFVALVTFSFEALSAREAAQGRCPITGAVALAAETDPPTCPRMEERLRCPATGATSAPSVPSGRCPAGGDLNGPTRAGLSI